MYKLLLCLRYLRTRYIALASVISVMLGVATMIVVNSVMSGFTTEMRNRLHGILSDVVLESRSLNGFADADWHMEQIRKVAGDSIEAMTPTVTVPAMLSFRYRGESITRPVQLIGIDEKTQSQVSDFGKYLQHPANRESMSFGLREGGYDTRDHQAGAEAPERPQMRDSGWKWRRMVAEAEALNRRLNPPATKPTPEKTAPVPGGGEGATDVFGAAPAEERVFDPAKEQHAGVVLGIALTSWRDHDAEDHFLVLPGDDVQLIFPNADTPPKGMYDSFTVVDFYESKMSEYDSQFVFVPLAKLQELRGMFNPTTKVGMVNQIQIKLKPGVDGNGVRDRLQKAFPGGLYTVSTWQDKQGPLLAAVQMETAILNVLLFLIIAVAGFGILAIFLMIVIDKTRDIGILKSLGGVACRDHGHLPRLWAVARTSRLRRGAGDRPRIGQKHQCRRRPAGEDHGPARLRSVHLLLLQNSYDHRPVDDHVDRFGGPGHRRAGQRASGVARGVVAPGGGVAL